MIDTRSHEADQAVLASADGTSETASSEPARNRGLDTTRRPGPTRRHTLAGVAIWAGASLALALVVAALLFQLSGGRWFIVQTPSMGTQAPVGTLVLTTPAHAAELHVGDVITFHPPTSPRETYTHRIVGITQAATGPVITTRGDINGATDPWTLSQRDVVGKATTIIPRLGWLIRAAPILLVGFAFVMLLTRLVRVPARRVAFRILGFSMLLSLTAAVLKPFVGIVVLAGTATKSGADATVVSTGMLPISVSATHGSTVDLSAGQVGVVHVSALADKAGYHLASALHLTLWEWIAFGAICAIPMLWCFVVGLPPTPDALEADALEADALAADALAAAPLEADALAAAPLEADALEATGGAS